MSSGLKFLFLKSYLFPLPDKIRLNDFFYYLPCIFCYSYLCEDSLIDEPIKYLGDLFTVSYYLDIKLLTERIEKMIKRRKLDIDIEKLKYFSERLKNIKSGDRIAESVEDLQ